MKNRELDRLYVKRWATFVICNDLQLRKPVSCGRVEVDVQGLDAEITLITTRKTRAQLQESGCMHLWNEPSAGGV